MVIGGDVGGACVFDDGLDDGFALLGCGAAEVDRGAVAFCCGDFGGSRNGGHDYVGLGAEGAGGEGKGLGVVT